MEYIMSIAFIGFVILIVLGFKRRKKKDGNHKKYFIWSVALLAVSLVSYLFVDDTKFQPTAEELAAQEEEKDQKAKEKEEAEEAEKKKEEQENADKEAEKAKIQKEQEAQKLADEKEAKKEEEKLQKEKEEQEAKEKEEEAKVNTDVKRNNEKIDKKIKINEELSFLNYKLKMDTVHIYEKENKRYIDLTIDWLNLSFPDKTTFLRAASVDVYQGDKVLQETTGAWSDSNSDVYFPNAVGGRTDVNLTYELKDINNPIQIVFVPNDEHDKNQEVIIKIK